VFENLVFPGVLGGCLLLGRNRAGKPIRALPSEELKDLENIPSASWVEFTPKETTNGPPPYFRRRRSNI
jgi:hypothetical protein